MLAASLFSFGCAVATDAPGMRAGVLDLSTWRFEEDATVPIRGEWLICWGELVEPDSADCPGRGWEPFPVPRLWSDSSVSSPIGGKGVASYRATLELPSDEAGLTLRVGSPLTAYRLWINGKDRGGVGTVGRSAEAAISKLENRLYALPPGAARVELLVHVANFEFRGGGLRREWYVGRNDQVLQRNSNELLLYALFATTSFVIGLVFLAQFAFRPAERAPGWFGLFAILVGLRIIPGSTGDMYQLLGGWASFGQLIRLEYMNTALVIATSLAYLRDKVPGAMPPRVTQVLMFAALALVPLHLFAPLEIVMATITPILVLPPLVLLVTITSYGRAARQHLPGATSTLVVLGVFGVGAIHDVFRTQTGWGAPIELFPYFVVVFIASEARSLLKAFASSFATAEQLSEQLQESNFELQETEEAVVRFLPIDFLRALGKKSIRDVAAGDHVSVHMTVMSCDFPIAEQDSPVNTFSFVNDTLRSIEPSIRARSGFVAQQFGDHLVALFPRAADDAVESAFEIQQTFRALARGGVRFGVGVATGPVLLGTVGDGESLASVVVGSPADLARRLRERARNDRTGVLISESTRAALGDRSRHTLVEVGSMVAGDSPDPRPVFEVADGS